VRHSHSYNSTARSAAAGKHDTPLRSNSESIEAWNYFPH
jgi:hypothetical protein